MGLSGLSDELVDCLSSHALDTEPAQLWVFGYGSLCWRPGFEYTERRIGRVHGFTRRFWQGSVTHRGTREKGTTWGCAFCITDAAAINYLHNREVALGGYQTRVVRFQPRDERQGCFPAMTYVATDENPHWLGPAPLARLAEQVAAAGGWKGPNADYVLQLVQFMTKHIPEEQDGHLFELAALVQAATAGELPAPPKPAAGGWRRRCSRDDSSEAEPAPAGAGRGR